MKRIQGAAMLGAFAWGLGAIVECAAVSPVDVSRNTTSLPVTQPATPAVAPATRAAEAPSLRIVEPRAGATLAMRQVRVRVVASHVRDPQQKLKVTAGPLAPAPNPCPAPWGLGCAPYYQEWLVPLRDLVNGWKPWSADDANVYRASGSLPGGRIDGVTFTIDEDPDTYFPTGGPSLQGAGLHAEVTMNLIAEGAPSANLARETGAAAGEHAPSAAGMQSAAVPRLQPAASTAAAAARPAVPGTTAIGALGNRPAGMHLVEPAPGSTTTPATTRIRATAELLAPGGYADVEVSWKDYAARTGPMQSQLVASEDTKTWRVTVKQLVDGFVVPADNICACTNAQASVRVRPAGTSAWQDSVAFDVVAATPGGTTASSPKAWSPTQPSSSPSESSSARSTLLTPPAARAPVQPLAPASAFGRP